MAGSIPDSRKNLSDLAPLLTKEGPREVPSESAPPLTNEGLGEVPKTPCNPPLSRSGEPNTAPKQKRPTPKRDRTPVDRLLPEPVVAELLQSIHGLAKITTRRLVKFDERFQIKAKYGVSRRRLGHYLRQVHADRLTESSQQPPHVSPQKHSHESPVTPDVSPAPYHAALTAHRRRQASVGAILDATLGRLAECHPDLWERRTYLLFVGLIYERLATCEAEISTDDLASLSKVLTENRRAEAQSQKSTPTEKSSSTEQCAKAEAPPTSDLPDNFTDIVRQVYGTNFQLSASAPAANAVN